MTDPNPLEPREVDPYRAPQSGFALETANPGAYSGTPLDWEPFEALRFGFESVRRYPISILAAFVASLVASIVGGIGSIAQNVLGLNGDERLVLLGAVIYVVCLLLNIPLAAWMGVGQARYALALVRGERPELTVIFRGEGLLAAIGVQCVYVFGAIAVGIVLFFPAILLFKVQWSDLGVEPFVAAGAGLLVFLPLALFFAARMSLANTAIAARGAGTFESMGDSWRLTAGQLWPFVLFFLLFFVLSVVAYIVGLLVCCVGVLVTVPAAVMMFYVGTAYAYQKRSGVEPVLPAA